MLIGWIASLRARDGKEFNKILVAILILCSLFPESMLGEVSEMYAMASLWPLAVLSALILTFYKNSSHIQYHRILVCMFCIIFCLNITSTRTKTLEILKSGESAHGLRMNMLELTKDLPLKSKIAVIYRLERPQDGFSRFGEKGIQSGCGMFINRPYDWSFFQSAGEIPNTAEFDMILIENEDQTHLKVYDSSAGAGPEK